MAQEQAPPGGPDLRQGVAFSELVDGKLVGHVGQEEVLLVRTGPEGTTMRLTMTQTDSAE